MVQFHHCLHPQHFLETTAARPKGNMTRKIAVELSAIDDLENERRVRIHEIIDKLRELGVSVNVSLPPVSDFRLRNCKIMMLIMQSWFLSVINPVGSPPFWKG